MSRRPNVVQAGGGNGMDVIGGLLNTWQRKKNIDYRWGRDNQLLDRQHELATQRDKTKMMNNIMAEGTIGAFQSHFDAVKDTRQHGQKIEQTKQQGRQERLSETHRSKRATKDLKDQSRGLYDNSQDPSTGISPLMSAPGRLQNIGPLLKGNPLLGVGENPATGGKSKGKGKRKGKPAPLAPQVGTDATPDKGWGQPEIPFGDTGAPSVTAPKIKKASSPRAKKTGTDDNSYGGA